MPEWSNGAVSKTAVRFIPYPGFESLPLRHFFAQKGFGVQARFNLEGEVYCEALAEQCQIFYAEENFNFIYISRHGS